jgi:hypothetical protein
MLFRYGQTMKLPDPTELAISVDDGLRALLESEVPSHRVTDWLLIAKFANMEDSDDDALLRLNSPMLARHVRLGLLTSFIMDEQAHMNVEVAFGEHEDGQGE